MIDFVYEICFELKKEINIPADYKHVEVQLEPKRLFFNNCEWYAILVDGFFIIRNNYLCDEYCYELKLSNSKEWLDKFF